MEGRYREIDHQYEKAIEVYRTLFTLFPDNVDYGLKLAAVAVRGSKGHDALATVESLRKLAPPASEDPRIDLAEADAWWVLGDSKRQEEPLARAIGKARAQGARLILARALEDQCYVIRRSSAKRRMRLTLAANPETFSPPPETGKAKPGLCALRRICYPTSGTCLESIRLYQQALTIFQKNGSEAGVASVLNNLGRGL